MVVDFEARDFAMREFETIDAPNIALLTSNVSSIHIEPTPIDLLERSALDFFFFFLPVVLVGIGSAWTLIDFYSNGSSSTISMSYSGNRTYL